MRIKCTNRTFALIVFLSIAIVLIIIQLFSTGLSGEVDSITHYQFARYAVKHHELFLHHWGKPLFTILSAPLAQFGYTGAIAFNLICGLFAGWFAYLITKRMEYHYAWPAIIFTVFTPLYLFTMYSSLTEILFSLVLIIAVYLFINKHFTWSSIVISLIPFARTEGILFIILFILALIWIKQYKALPFLLTGFIFFSLLGIPVYHDFFWFFTQMPYNAGSAALYGSGSFWVYFKRAGTIINYPLLILGITGLIYILLNLKKGFKNIHDVKVVTLYFLIIPGFFLFILAQSFLWWGGSGILASDRFIACVLPLGAILATAGFEWVMEKAAFNKIIYRVTGTLMIIAVVYEPFTYHKLPMKGDQRFAVMQKLTTWLKASPYDNRHAFYADPVFPFYMGFDPFNPATGTKVYSYVNTDPATMLKPGELLIWDTHFSGFEGHLPFDSVMNNNNLHLLKIFMPDERFTVLGNQEYQLAVFIKAPRDTTASIFKPLSFNDFENILSAGQMEYVSTEFSTSGKQSIQLNPQNIYSPAEENNLTSLPGISDVTLKASVKILNPSATENDKINLIISVDDRDNKVFKYNAAKDTETHKPNEWFTLKQTVVINRNNPVGGKYKVYVWYQGKNKIFVDDLKLEYLPVTDE